MKRKAEPDAEDMASSKGPSTSKKLAPDTNNDFINETVSDLLSERLSHFHSLLREMTMRNGRSVLEKRSLNEFGYKTSTAQELRMLSSLTLNDCFFQNKSRCILFVGTDFSSYNVFCCC